MSISCEIDLTWLPWKQLMMSTLVYVMTRCRQAASLYLTQYWPRSVSHFGVTRPHWIQRRLDTKITLCFKYLDMIYDNVAWSSHEVCHCYIHIYHFNQYVILPIAMLAFAFYCTFFCWGNQQFPIAFRVTTLALGYSYGEMNWNWYIYIYIGGMRSNI